MKRAALATGLKLNTLDTPMNLKGVGLSDRSDRIIFLFPDVSLAPGGRVIVFADGKNQDDPAGTFHAKFKLSSLGEAVYLFDELGLAIDYVQVPTLNADELRPERGGPMGENERLFPRL